MFLKLESDYNRFLPSSFDFCFFFFVESLNFAIVYFKKNISSSKEAVVQLLKCCEVTTKMSIFLISKF